jgi:hypothetical protein
MPGENIQDWSTTAASNATADSSINWAEGQARATVNDSARSMMAAWAKHRNLQNGSITTGGSANAQTFSSGLSYTSIPTGLVVRLKLGLSNTGSATLKMDSTSATSIRDESLATINAGALVSGTYATFRYDGTYWVLLRTPSYEFGTWTPTLTFATPGGLDVGYATRTGIWTKIGRLVTLQVHIVTDEFDKDGGTSGQLRITGVPFTAGAQGLGSLHWGGISKTSYTDLNLSIASGAVLLTVKASGSGQATADVQASDMPDLGTVTLIGSIPFIV